MNSKRIGNISEAKVIAYFVSKGYPVLIPFGDNEKYDLVVEMDGKFERIQVKTANFKKDYFTANTCMSYGHRKRGKVLYTKNDIDFFAVYIRELDNIYLIPIDDVDQTCFQLRLNKTKNGQSKNIRYAEKYFLE